MRTTLCYSILFLTLGTFSVQSLTLLQSSISTYEGGSYFQRVTDANLDILKCKANFTVYIPTVDYKTSSKKNVVIDLDIHSSNAVFPADFEDTTNLKDRLHSIGSGFCGFKVDNGSRADPTEWTVEVTADKTESAKFTVSFYDTPEQHAVKEISIGLDMTICCESARICSENIQTDLSYCYMYNPKGELVNTGEKCKYSTSAAVVEDLGNWTCIFGKIPFVKPMEITIEVITKDTVQPEKWVNETSDYVSLGCKIQDCCTTIPDYCIMTSPVGEKIRIMPGSASVRYTSLFANLKERICAIEIKKPLLETERGAWICELNNRGLFLQVDKKTADRDETFSSSTTTELGKPFRVSCKLPYSNSHCFITSPTGERHEPKPVRYELGECSRDFTAAGSQHNGIWVCSFLRDDDIVSVQQKFEVIVRDSIKCSIEVSTIRGHDVTMFCNTGRAPIDYCWFSSPTGKTYQLKDGTATSDVSYTGNGLTSGDCGMKIYHAQDEDIGNWTCTIKIGGRENFYTITLDLSTQVVSLAAGLGAGIGVSVALFGVIGGLLYRRHRKRSRLQMSDTNSDNVETNESSVLHHGHSDRLYTL